MNHPMSPSGQITNAFRFSLENQNLLIHDLATGRWVSLPTQGREPELRINVNFRLVAGLTRRMPELAALAPLSDVMERPTLDDVIQVFARIPDRTQPHFPMPTITQIRNVASPFPGCRPLGSSVEADITAVSMGASALAWRGGSARDYELEQDLHTGMTSPKEVRVVQDISRMRSKGNIVRLGNGVQAQWHLNPDWSKSPWSP